MAEPTSKTTRSKKGMRRSHHAIKNVVFAVCKNCGAAIRPHNLCENCGYYKNRFYNQMIKAPKVKKKEENQS